MTKTIFDGFGRITLLYKHTFFVQFNLNIYLFKNTKKTFCK